MPNDNPAKVALQLKVDNKGRITVPYELRSAYGIEIGDEVEMALLDNVVLLSTPSLASKNVHFVISADSIDGTSRE